MCIMMFCTIHLFTQGPKKFINQSSPSSTAKPQKVCPPTALHSPLSPSFTKPQQIFSPPALPCPSSLPSVSKPQQVSPPPALPNSSSLPSVTNSQQVCTHTALQNASPPLSIIKQQEVKETIPSTTNPPNESTPRCQPHGHSKAHKACPHCSATYAHNSSLSRHIKHVHHGVLSESKHKNIVCNLCNKR